MALEIIKKQWKFFIATLSPIVLLILPYYWKGTTGKEPYAAYVIMLMAVYWMTECLPLAVTSFMPIALFPLFGIVDSDKIATVYMKDSILFLLSGVIIALAVECSNLHTRIAIRVILAIGAKIPRLLFGIMMTTMFLSMWMNNTSTTAMMAPIVLAIIEQLRSKMISQMNLDDRSKEGATEMTSLKHSDIPDGRDETETWKNDQLVQITENIRNLKVMFLIATAYSSNIGGTGVLTGSATNIVALDLVRKDADEDYCPAECKRIMEIGFLHWMLFNAPPMILNTLVCWVYLQIHFLGIPPSWKFWQNKRDATKNVNSAYTMEPSLEKSVMKALQEKYAELGPINFHEIGVLVIFSITVFLWIFKDPQFMPGWDSLPIFKRTASGRSFIKECTPTLLMCTLLFVIPKDIQYYKNFMRGGLREGMKDTLLTWKFMNEKFPWGVFILLGGGNAISLGSSKSNLNNWVEEILKESETLKAFPAPVLLILMLCMITALTTLASNIATAAIITPVLLKLSYVKDLHPLYMALPAATVCSYAFMLPVSTAPNAIAYNAAPEMKLGHMVKAGFAINVLSIVVLLASTHTVGDWIFGLSDYHHECTNMTLTAVSPVVEITKEQASFWITRCIPVEVTSLLPVALVPLLGIADSETIVSAYLNETVLFYLGICIFSLAIECSELHIRIALNILYYHCRGISSLLLGTMFTTAFISILVGNSLCASMMTPIIVSILDDLESGAVLNPTGQHFPKSVMTLFAAKDALPDVQSEFASASSGPSLFPSLMRKLTFVEVQSHGVEGSILEDSPPKYPSVASAVMRGPGFSYDWSSSIMESNLINQPYHRPGPRTLFLIASAFAANIGGTMLLISNGTNIVALHVVSRARGNIEDNPSQVVDSTECLRLLKLNMFTWFEFNAIPACLNVLLGFLFFKAFLTCLGDGYRKNFGGANGRMMNVEATRDMLKRKLDTLGPMTFQEYSVCTLYAIWIILLMFESPHNFPGWAEPFGPYWIGGSTSTFLVVSLLFIIPRNSEFFRSIPSAGLCPRGHETLLTWEYVQVKLPWKTLLLLGGGSAILLTSSTSGLRTLVIELLSKSGIGRIPTLVLLNLISCSVAVVTSFVANTTACFLIAPVTVEMAFASGAHPLYFVLPAATICSYAFLFTISSPPNAIFASINSVKQIDVFKSGCCLLLISLTTLLVITHTFGELIFEFSNYKGYCNPR